MFESLQLFSTRINSDLFVPRYLEQFVIFPIKASALDLGFIFPLLPRNRGLH